jgi:hypothetical protein
MSYDEFNRIMHAPGMSNYVPHRTLQEVRALHGKPKAMIYYAFSTCWWGTKTYRCDKHDFPCGPRGELLMMTDDVAKFIESAEANPSHYGKHGLRAFEAALDGNVIAGNGCTTSLETWDEYNALIDAYEANRNGKEASDDHQGSAQIH